MNKALGMLGLAKRAGKVTSGEFLCEKAIKQGQSKLIIIASGMQVQSYNIWDGSLTADDGRTRRMTAGDGKKLN